MGGLFISKTLKCSVAVLVITGMLLTGCSGSSGQTGKPAEKQAEQQTQTLEQTSDAAESSVQEETVTTSGGADSGMTTADAAAADGTRAAAAATAADGTGAAAAATAATAEASAELQDSYEKEKRAALNGLAWRTEDHRLLVYVYKDFGLTENHFTQKAKMAGKDEDLVLDMDENWTEDPFSGDSCIRCEQITQPGDWGGWLFLNGYLPEGESIPRLNDGSMDGQGLDLSGAASLSFCAKGEKGGEKVEFFTAGFGYDGETNIRTVEYPDSARKRSLGVVTLTDSWQQYDIPLEKADMSYIVCGFGYVLSGDMDGDADNVFYLDDISFNGDIRSAWNAPVMMRSYDTDNIYIRNAAFSYDNALAALAFMSEGRQSEAEELVDAFVYAVENDRALGSEEKEEAEGADSGEAGESGTPIVPKRIRNAYAAGDISSYPGWDSGARLPGWYDNETGEWYEDRYQVGSNVGNTSYAAMALMQYYNMYGGEKYLNTARSLMDWVIENCSDGGDGFTGGFDGWEEGDPPVVYPFTYKSIEHNIDAYAVFKALYKATGEEKYKEAAESAKRLIISLYDEDRGLFMTGTKEDGVTPNTDVVVLDAQVWCAMALGEDFEPYADALKIVDQMRTEEGGYPFCLENKNGGWWAEGTAYTALMYRGIGELEKYQEAMDALSQIQEGSGLFPAATNDHLSTGMDLFDGSPWEYSTDPHIAPAAWFIMAANGFNPYQFQ